MSVLDYFFPQRENNPRLGRVSPIDVEIQDNVGDWYYFGKVEMFETETEIGEGEKKEKKKLYLYRLLTKFKEDEKIIVSDEDLIHNANQIPYTRTIKGEKRLQQVILFTFSFVYLLTVYLAYLLVQAGPNIIYYPQVVNMLIWDFGTIASVFAIGAIIWAIEARYHHFVSDWQIQPLRINSVRVNTDFYILVNSSKVPIYQKVQELAKLTQNDIDKLVDAIRIFEKNEIDRLQSQVATLQEQLEILQATGMGNYLEGTEIALLSRTQVVRERLNMIKYTAILLFSVALVALIVYISMGGRL
ncbi:MAG: hypothetical protein C0175_05560 [Caldisericum exile]|uniref:Uncharacterized protein n=1 Tax=Caldisericum exile TaxID=693075 RepID=A0A2J6X4P5_9BACT|nr:MAG: hypothetical protein C0175_05560 [Caldisericum exile]